jgi:hypothetical protein
MLPPYPPFVKGIFPEALANNATRLHDLSESNGIDALKRVGGTAPATVSPSSAFFEGRAVLYGKKTSASAVAATAESVIARPAQ